MIIMRTALAMFELVRMMTLVLAKTYRNGNNGNCDNGVSDNNKSDIGNRDRNDDNVNHIDYS